MSDLLKQLASASAAAFAGACCLGLPAALSVLSVVGVWSFAHARVCPPRR